VGLGRAKTALCDEIESGAPHEFAPEIEERLLEIVVRLGRNFVVLQVFLPVEGHGARLHLAFLDVDLVPAKDNRDVFTDALEVTVPVWYILVCDSRGNVEHDDTALALDIISIAETTEFLLASGIPDVEANAAKVSRETNGVNLDTESG